MNVYLLMSRPPGYVQYFVDSVYHTHNDAKARVRQLIGRLADEPEPGSDLPALRGMPIVAPDDRVWRQRGETHWDCADGSSMYIEGHPVSAYVEQPAIGGPAREVAPRRPSAVRRRSIGGPPRGLPSPPR